MRRWDRFKPDQDSARRMQIARKRRRDEPAAKGARASWPNRLWTFLNSPIFLALLTSVLIAGAVKYYDYRQRMAADLDVRRAAYVELLAELQLRVSKLQEADSRLNEYIGVGPTLKGASPMPESGARREIFERESERVGREQGDILAGRGGYVPTAPAYANVDMLTLAARLEHLGGIPDYFVGSLRMLRVLDAPPDLLWIFVRAYVPMLQDFVVRRHLLYTSGRLPLPPGAELSSDLEKRLGIRALKPGELEKIKRESDKRFDELQKALRGTEK